jgi:hypothetical protein
MLGHRSLGRCQRVFLLLLVDVVVIEALEVSLDALAPSVVLGLHCRHRRRMEPLASWSLRPSRNQPPPFSVES